MNTTYKSTFFACCYFCVLLFVAAMAFLFAEVPAWAVIVLVACGLLGWPLAKAQVEINDEGIVQQTFNRRSVARWSDVISWERVSDPGSDGPDVITIKTRAGSFALNHNCVYGKRLDFVESELRRRIAQPGGAANRSRPVGSETNGTSAAADSGG
jgi:hypothetical protein